MDTCHVLVILFCRLVEPFFGALHPSVHNIYVTGVSMEVARLFIALFSSCPIFLTGRGPAIPFPASTFYLSSGGSMRRKSRPWFTELNCLFSRRVVTEYFRRRVL